MLGFETLERHYCPHGVQSLVEETNHDKARSRVTALKNVFSRKWRKGFQSRKKSMYTDNILDEECGSHIQTDHYFVAFLTASSSPSHITPQISVDPERKMSSGTLDHLESQVLSPSISGVSVGPVRTWRESKISRQSQLLLLPEPRPLWRGGEP